MSSQLHRIVIVGGGAGGLELATKLGNRLGRSKQAAITLVDEKPTHIWKPLLHEVASGSLNAYEEELNYFYQAKQHGFEFSLGRMSGLNRKTKSITLRVQQTEEMQESQPYRELTYDTLIIAVGSCANDFGTPGVSENCLFLDTRAQAERLHQHLLEISMMGTPANSINIAIIGGGATGVELSAELRHAFSELSEYKLNLQPSSMQIVLIEAGERILPALPINVANVVRNQLHATGVEVLENERVTKVDKNGIYTTQSFIQADIKIWAAGIKAPEFLSELDGLETNRVNQLVVTETLQCTKDESIFAFGDCAYCLQPDGSSVPPRAQAAHQQAMFLYKAMNERLHKQPLSKFRFNDKGSLISLSRFTTVGNIVGKLTNDIMIEGRSARFLYVSLYRYHQHILHGGYRTLLMMLKSAINSRTKPPLKLH